MPNHRIDSGFKLEASGDSVRLDIFDVIGDGFFGGVSAKSVAKALEPHAKAKNIDVHINSPGGSAFDGITIYNLLHQHKAKVAVYVDGLAASAASIIAMAGDDIVMAENAMMMIHNASGITMGNADDHRQTADVLDTIDTQIVTTYASRTGLDADEVASMMDNEKWLTANEAVELGFATEVTEAKKVAAHFDASILNQFKNVPADVAALITKDAGQPADTPGDTSMSDITPEAFADKYPDAVTNWRNEGYEAAVADIENKTKEAETKGFDEGVKNERGRVAALTNAFGQHPAFLLKMVNAGHDLAKAKAEAFDAKLGLEPGHDGLNLNTGAAIGNEDGSEITDAQKRHIEAAKRIPNAHARELYCKSVNLDPALVK